MYINNSKLLVNCTDINIFCTTKNWWYSKWLFTSLNLWLHVWDKDENVIASRKELSKSLGNSFSDFVYMNQIHSWEVISINNNDKWKWTTNIESAIDCDALITNKSWIVLTVLVADCIPVIFFDNVKKVIWVAHAWWKWTEKKIVKNTITKMIEDYNSNPSDIIVYMWPSILQGNFEVWKEFEKKFDSIYLKKKNNWKFLLDLAWVNKSQLINSWVTENNIEISTEDTFIKNSEYFSARRDWYNSWRFWIGISLK